MGPEKSISPVKPAPENHEHKPTDLGISVYTPG